MPNIKRHAFRHERDCSHCSIRREREEKIAKVKGEIALLDQFKTPHPKASSNLGLLNHFEAQCHDGTCHQ